jgi:selenocysteine lyase/cysteine desulfurase
MMEFINIILIMKISIREKINKINNLISKHEEEIANPILEYLFKNNNFQLIGKSKISNKNRAPTISFTSKNKTSKEISEILVKNKIATRNDNFYAWRCLKTLGIDTNDGVVRISLTHYNTIQEVEKLIKILDTI